MRWALIIGVAALGLALAVAALPARLLPRLLPDDALRLSGVRGTLLEGEAARAILRTPAGYLHLGRLSWTLHPASLLTLAPRLDLRSAWGAQRASLQARVRGAQVRLQDVDASIDARLLRTLAPLAVDGRLSLQFPTLTLDAFRPTQASGRIVWQSARWQAGSREYALGTYVAEVESSEDASIRATVDTLSGPVFTRGYARLAGSAYDLEFQIDGGDQALAPEVERALRLFATPREDGYLLRLDGDLAVAP